MEVDRSNDPTAAAAAWSQTQSEVSVPPTLVSSSPSSSPPAIHKSLLSLDDDVFHYLCAFVPVDDLLLRVAAVSRDVRQRVWTNHELWQQLWLRYLVQFFHSLIPSHPARSSSAVSAATTPSPSSVSPWPVGAEGTAAAAAAAAATVTATTAASGVPLTSYSDVAWRLYHYHRSQEARPRVELLDRLSVTAEDLSDPQTEEAPTSVHYVTAAEQMKVSRDNIHAQALLFAQACATQLVANNTIVTRSDAAAAAAAPQKPSTKSDTPASQGLSRRQKVAALQRRQQRQADRLRRALHFLLSANDQRPAFEDRLWTSTYEAGEAYQREVHHATSHPPRRRRALRAQAKLHVTAVKDRLRPLSWLDDRENSVKVILFDDNSRIVGNAGTVQAERIKLLGAIAHHWRLAYAHQFYLTPTDGVDRGAGQPSPPSLHPSVVLSAREPARAEAARTTVGGVTTGGTASARGRVSSWEQTYRRFRDDPSSTSNGLSSPAARIRESLRRVVVAADDNDSSVPSDPLARRLASASSRASVIPSSGNPLFDMHLLTYARRKQFYGAMLASTVEVPDGMGAFVATSVSESFLRWWCWRSRRLMRLAAAPPPPFREESQPSSMLTLQLTKSAEVVDGVAPRTIWVARVCSVHKPQYGTTASDGSFGRPAPMEAEESIAYSSSYSDVTSTDTLASDSSIEFEEEILVVDDGAAGAEAATTLQDGDALQALRDGAAAEPSTQPRTPQQQQQPAPSPSSQSSRTLAPRVALLFPLHHMLAYWFMMHHVTFYSYQVYRGMWGDQEITIAVCSRILSPTGHCVECRLFYSLRCSSFPRMYTKMMFTPGTLPSLTLPEKLSSQSPYRSPSSTSSGTSNDTSSDDDGDDDERRPAGRDSDSDSSEEDEEVAVVPADTDGNALPPSPNISFTSSAPRQKRRYASVDHRPVDSGEVYDLFWTGFGRVEVESGPTISRANLIRLRVSLGLPEDYPMGLLWNVLMFASGVGPLILKDHRHSLYFNYSKSFTDVLEEEFGEASCYGYGARPTPPSMERAMPNPLDAEVARMQEQHLLDEAARALVEGIAASAHQNNTNRSHNNNNGSGEAATTSQMQRGTTAGGDASYSTLERGETTQDSSPSSDSPTSSLTTSTTTYGSWGLDSDFSSMGEHSSWRDWHTPYSDAL